MLGKYSAPEDVLYLVEDLVRLDLLIDVLDKIEPRNITAIETQEQRNFGVDMLQSQIALVMSWRRIAQIKLQQYLAP